MYQSTYYVGKTTDTFADTLLAYGVAALVERLLQAKVGQTTVRVQDAGSVYAITLEDPVEEGFEELDWFCDLPFMSTYRCTRQDRGVSLGKITADREIHDGSERKIVYFSIRGYLRPRDGEGNSLSYGHRRRERGGVQGFRSFSADGPAVALAPRATQPAISVGKLGASKLMPGAGLRLCLMSGKPSGQLQHWFLWG
jgi:hypothetical protein